MDLPRESLFSFLSQLNDCDGPYQYAAISVDTNDQFTQVEVFDLRNMEGDSVATNSSANVSINLEPAESEFFSNADRLAVECVTTEIAPASSSGMMPDQLTAESCQFYYETTATSDADEVESGMLLIQQDAESCKFHYDTDNDDEIETPHQGCRNVEILTIEELDIKEEIFDEQHSDDESSTLATPIIEPVTKNVITLGCRLWPSNCKVQHYTKGCQWSPDGVFALVVVHLDGMYIIKIPDDIQGADVISSSRKMTTLRSALHISSSAKVYDYCWYPFMNSHDAITCCYISSSKYEPIHLWSANDGGLICSYRSHEEVMAAEAAISVVFSNYGEKIYAGYRNSIKIFDTKIPSVDSGSIPVTSAVACIALNFSNNYTLTAGTWNSTINHYDIRAPSRAALFTLEGHRGGISWLRYAPGTWNNCMLFSGARRDDKILQWDLRNYSKPVREFRRNSNTNQRIYFDLSPECELLASGDTQGLLRFWNVFNPEASYQVPLHIDTCNGVSFNQKNPVIATTSGQYHVECNRLFEDTPNLDKSVRYENSVMFLWLGKTEKNA